MRRAIFITFVSTLLIFIPVLIFNDSIYVFAGDGFETYLPFYLGLSRFLTQFWTETITFGSNSFIFLIGYIFSPFLVLSGLFPQTMVVRLLWAFDLVRFALMTLFAYLWLSKIAKSVLTRTIGSLMYTFSGFVLYFLHYSPFYDSYILIPLLLYLIEEVVFENKKKFIFTLVIMYTILLNAYFFYIISWILVFYYITRIAEHRKIGRIVSLLLSKETFSLIIYYILGVGLSAFVLFPVVNIIISNPRLNVDTTQLIHFDIGLKQAYNLISSFYSPVITDYESNIFISKLSFPEARISYHYSLVVFTFLFILNLIEYQKMNFIKVLIWITSYLITFLPIVNLVLNGNPGDIRWHIWLILINILLSIDILDNIEKYRKKSIYLAFLLNSFLVVGLFLTSKALSLAPSNNFREQIFVIIFVVAISFIYAFLFTFKKKKYIYIVLTLALILESTFVLYHRVYENNQATYIKAVDLGLTLNEDKEVIEKIQEIDSSFYRIEFVKSMINHPNMLNYAGFTSYLSLYNQNVRGYLDGRYSTYWIIDEVPSKWLSKNLLSGKYIVIDRENKAYEIPFGFSLFFSTSKYDVYINQFSTSFGFATNNAYSINELQKLDKSIQDNVLLQAIFTDVSTRSINLDEFIMPEQIYESVSNHQIVAESVPGYYLIDYQNTWPYTECDVEKYRGDTVTDYYTRYEYSYFTLENTNDFDRFFLYCHSVYTRDKIVPYTVYFYSDETMAQLYENKASFDHVELISKSGNGYEAEVSISEPESMVFLSVPYDDAWILEVNGKRHDFENVNDGFIGIKLDSIGHYEIKMMYRPKGLYSGIVISLITLVLILFLYISKLRRSQVKREQQPAN